ncbi:hypothetical protein BDW75DRAFT_206155 [Aspergillus navahoensis]
MCGSDMFLAILAIFFPPVSVWIKVGICTADSIINLALCCLGYVPGLIHAWYIILKNPEPDYDDPSYQPVPNRREDVENGHVTYYYVSHQPASNRSQRGYGTMPSQHASNAQSQSTPPAPKPQHEHSAAGGSSQANEDTSPPTYAEAVKGDHKVQNHD